MGKLIVLEGTDGSGKATQTAKLLERLQAEGVFCRTVEFPRYHEESSALIRMYLGGAFGNKPSDVNAYAAATFFAVDRYASFKQDWGGFYEEGGLVLADRYTTSNAVHQGGKLLPEERSEYFRWLFDFEYRLMGLPVYTGTKRSQDKKYRADRVQEMLRKMDLTDQADLRPSQLSGGQQQRTALARILVSDPQILMLDEPFSALDSHLRFRMEQEVRGIMEDFGKTVLMVSHDRDEVFRLSHRIAVMHQGQVDIYGTRDEVFADPKTRNACMLTGCKNISPVRKIDDHHVLALDWDMMLETEKEVGDAAYIGIRHHDTNGTSSRNIFLCDVTSVVENPFSMTVMLRLAGHPDARSFGWELGKEQWSRIQAGQVEIRIPAGSIMLLSR